MEWVVIINFNYYFHSKRCYLALSDPHKISTVMQTLLPDAVTIAAADVTPHT